MDTFAFEVNQSSTARRMIDEQRIHRRRRSGLDVVDTPRRWQRWSEILDNICCGGNERPGNYHFARDHFHCKGRSRILAAIRGTTKQTREQAFCSAEFEVASAVGAQSPKFRAAKDQLSPSSLLLSQSSVFNERLNSSSLLLRVFTRQRLALVLLDL